MIALSFNDIRAQFVSPDAKAAQINDAVRAGLLDCAEFLIEVNLRQRKFHGRNRSLYGFAPRNPRYERRKRFAKLVRDPETGLKVQPDKPALDLRYTGRLRRFIESRGPEQYRKLMNPYANKIRLRVPIQVPGRKGGYMRQEQYDELGRWSEDEYATMSRMFTARIAYELGLGGSISSDLWQRRAG